MDMDYWRKQAGDKPLFEDLLWSRPENKRLAGKLLIVGGNAHGFSAPAGAYQEAEKAGIGVARVILPDAIQKIVLSLFETAYFAPSTPSGSFSQQSLDTMLEHAAWADGVLLAGDLGRNSETAIALEKFIDKYSGQLTVTKDALEYFKDIPQKLLQRPETTVVASIAQLQKMAQNARLETPITFDISLIQLVETLHQLTTDFPASVIVKHLDQIIVASGGQVSTTQLAEDKEIWRVSTAAHASVWWLQNPTKPFEALTTSLVPAP